MLLLQEQGPCFWRLLTIGLASMKPISPTTQSTTSEAMIETRAFLGPTLTTFSDTAEWCKRSTPVYKGLSDEVQTLHCGHILWLLSTETS